MRNVIGPIALVAWIPLLVSGYWCSRSGAFERNENFRVVLSDDGLRVCFFLYEPVGLACVLSRSVRVAYRVCRKLLVSPPFKSEGYGLTEGTSKCLTL